MLDGDGVSPDGMADSEQYAREKLEAALRTLATGAGDVRSRLQEAYEVFHPLRRDHLPDELKQDHDWIMTQLTKHKPSRNYRGDVVKGSVEVSLGRMRNSTGVKIAKRLLYIRDRLVERKN